MKAELCGAFVPNVRKRTSCVLCIDNDPTVNGLPSDCGATFFLVPVRRVDTNWGGTNAEMAGNETWESRNPFQG